MTFLLQCLPFIVVYYEIITPDLLSLFLFAIEKYGVHSAGFLPFWLTTVSLPSQFLASQWTRDNRTFVLNIMALPAFGQRLIRHYFAQLSQSSSREKLPKVSSVDSVIGGLLTLAQFFDKNPYFTIGFISYFLIWPDIMWFRHQGNLSSNTTQYVQ